MGFIMLKSLSFFDLFPPWCHENNGLQKKIKKIIDTNKTFAVLDYNVVFVLKRSDTKRPIKNPTIFVLNNLFNVSALLPTFRTKC